MLHIVFEQSNVEALQKAIDLDESMQGDIVEIKDDFAVGPFGRYLQYRRLPGKKGLVENVTGVFSLYRLVEYC
jgi:hypothetical protein